MVTRISRASVLITARERRGVSSDGLAAKTGISRAYPSRVENGPQVPSEGTYEYCQ
jgi:transcriptional regulator with XRE-family HTH domain